MNVQQNKLLDELYSYAEDIRMDWSGFDDAVDCEKKVWFNTETGKYEADITLYNTALSDATKHLEEK